MLAAQLLGQKEIGLAALLSARLGVTLDKSSQRADWSRRPLTPVLVTYAAADVLHLHALVALARGRPRREGPARVARRGVRPPPRAGPRSRARGPGDRLADQGLERPRRRRSAPSSASSGAPARNGPARSTSRRSASSTTRRSSPSPGSAAAGEQDLAALFPRPVPAGFAAPPEGRRSRRRGRFPPPRGRPPRRGEPVRPEPELERAVYALKARRDAVAAAPRPRPRGPRLARRPRRRRPRRARRRPLPPPRRPRRRHRPLPLESRPPRGRRPDSLERGQVLIFYSRKSRPGTSPPRSRCRRGPAIRPASEEARSTSARRHESTESTRSTVEGASPRGRVPSPPGCARPTRHACGARRSGRSRTRSPAARSDSARSSPEHLAARAGGSPAVLEVGSRNTPPCRGRPGRAPEPAAAPACEEARDCRKRNGDIEIRSIPRAIRRV